VTDPRDPLTARLSALDDLPVPALLAADAVRGRGELLRRRQRAVYAATAAVVAVALAGTAALALGGTSADDDALRFASPSPSASPTTTAEPSSSPTPSATASPSPVVVPPPPSPAPTPSATATATATPPATPTAATWDPLDAFLSPEAAGAAEQPGWVVESDHPPRLGPGPVVDPCGTDTYAAAAEDEAERSMSSVRESGGSGLTQRVSRFADATSAAAVLGELVESFGRCPTQARDDGGTFRYTVVDDSAAGTDRTALVAVEECVDGACTQVAYVSYVLLAQVSDGVSETYYGVGEDGTPEDWARALLDASAEALRAANP
jgi:hypothetical protein